MDEPTKILKTYPPTEVGDFLIVVEDHEYKDYSMEFKAYECTVEDFQLNGVIQFHLGYDKNGGYTVYDFTSDHNEADVFMSGGLKWDGCINFKFHDPEESGVLLHCCGLKDTEKFSRLFRKLYAVAPDCIAMFDEELAK